MAFRDVLRRWLAIKGPEPPANDLAVKLQELDRAVRDLRLDWDATYDKFARLLARWSARDQRASPTSVVPQPAGNSHQERILARRAGLNRTNTEGGS